MLFSFFCGDCRARRPESNYIKVPLCVSASDWPLRKQKENATHSSFRKVYIVDLMGIDHALFFLSATSWGLRTGNLPSAEPPCQRLRRGYRTFFNQSQEPPGPLASGPA